MMQLNIAMMVIGCSFQNRCYYARYRMMSIWGTCNIHG